MRTRLSDSARRGKRITNLLAKTMVAAILVCVPVLAFSDMPRSPGFIGILENQNRDSDYETIRPSVEVRALPSSESEIIFQLDNLDATEAYEWDYEQRGLAVYAYEHDGTDSWYRVRIKVNARFGWVKGHKDLRFHGLSELVTNSLSYLTSEWDRRVFSDPVMSKSALKLAARGSEVPISVASTAMVEGKLWILVVVLQESPCSSSDAPPVLAAGWVPALSDRGQLNVWFYSRGC